MLPHEAGPVASGTKYHATSEPAPATLYLVVARYGSDAGRVAAARPAHHAYARTLRRAGHLLLGGPFADRSGAVFLYRAGSVAEVEGWIADDPFEQNGVFASVEVKAWSPVVGDHSALMELVAHLHEPAAAGR